MQNLSVVIVCKNAAAVIGATLESLKGLTSDIVIYDSGSTDDTKDIVKKTPANLFEGSWEGFGKTKNKANMLARYDWILSLDADEAIDEELKNELLHADLDDAAVVYELLFKNFFGEKWLRFGEWGHDPHTRMFNRKQVSWNDAEVHESLKLPAGIKKIRLRGYVLHKTTAGAQEFEKKMRNYADLNAEKYFRQNKKAGIFKMIFSPVFSFIRNYFFKLGLLDGRAGLDCARINMLYTFWKYKKLNQLNRK